MIILRLTKGNSIVGGFMSAVETSGRAGRKVSCSGFVGGTWSFMLNRKMKGMTWNRREE